MGFTSHKEPPPTLARLRVGGDEDTHLFSRSLRGLELEPEASRNERWSLLIAKMVFTMWCGSAPGQWSFPCSFTLNISRSILLFLLSCSPITLSQCLMHFSIKKKNTLDTSFCYLPKATPLSEYRFGRLPLALAPGPFQGQIQTVSWTHSALYYFCAITVLSCFSLNISNIYQNITIVSGLNLFYSTLIYRFDNTISYKINSELKNFYLYLFIGIYHFLFIVVAISIHGIFAYRWKAPWKQELCLNMMIGS